MEQFVLYDQSSFENTKWFLEGLCSQYKAAFDSLKEALPLCQFRLGNEQMEQFQYEIGCVESNLVQLEAQYKNLESSYYESIATTTNTSTDYGHTDNCVNLGGINQTYYQLEPSDNMGCELVNYTASDDIGPEKLSFSSMEYLLSIDESDDFFEFVKSQDGEDLCPQVDSLALLSSDQESQSQAGCVESKPEKRVSKSAQSRTSGSKPAKASGASKKSRPNESRVWYKCGWEGCSFGSYYNGVVKRHSLKRHSGKIKIDKSSNSSMHRFKCDWPGCEVSLVAYHKLVEHKRKHTGEKPFRCKWKSCNYATARLYSMIIHERTHKLDPFAE